jgi:hypothetical protein
VDKLQLGWEIRSEFHGIPQLFQFWTFSTPEFSSEFHFSDCKICSCQFGTRSRQFEILSCHRFFQFHKSEHVPVIFVCPPKSHLLGFQVKRVDVILAANHFPEQNHLRN